MNTTIQSTIPRYKLLGSEGLTAYPMKLSKAPNQSKREKNPVNSLRNAKYQGRPFLSVKVFSPICSNFLDA
jgi:hypothetical protein